MRTMRRRISSKNPAPHLRPRAHVRIPANSPRFRRLPANRHATHHPERPAPCHVFIQDAPAAVTVAQPNWAQLDSNTPRESRGKPHIASAGTAECAAFGDESGSDDADDGDNGGPADRPDDDHDDGATTPREVDSRNDSPEPSQPLGDDLARAIALLDRLPLTDNERAEAVRRMLRAQGDV